MIFLHIGDVKHVMLSVVKLATKDLDLSTDEEEVSFMLFEIKFSSNNNPPPLLYTYQHIANATMVNAKNLRCYYMFCCVKEGQRPGSRATLFIS